MRFRRRLAPKATVELVPMIDVIFQLVIFFMVTTTFMVVPGFKILYPESTTAEPVIMSRLVITLDSENDIYLNKDKHNLASLKTALGLISDNLKQEIKAIVIEGDRNVSYNLLVQVMDSIRNNGFRGVYLKLLEKK